MTQVKVDITCETGHSAADDYLEVLNLHVGACFERLPGISLFWDGVTVDDIKAAVCEIPPTHTIELNLFTRGGDSDEWTPA